MGSPTWLSRTIRNVLSTTATLLALVAVPLDAQAQAGASEGGCLKCMDYNHCEEQPDGLYRGCYEWPCRYYGSRCDNLMALVARFGIERRELRQPDGSFLKLVEVADGWFANYDCDGELVALARETADGRLSQVSVTTLSRALALSEVEHRLAQRADL